jgi:hypothetical protein
MPADIWNSKISLVVDSAVGSDTATAILDIRSNQMTAPARTVSRGLAGVLAELELAQPTVVSLAEITAVAGRVGLKTPPAVIADRLRRGGWLLPTGQRGMYEFAPAAHAGPYGHGDPFLTLRAARTAREFEASIALQSALWLRGLCDRAPDRHELAAAPGAAVPDAVIRQMRVVRFRAQLPPQLLDGLPVHHAASVLVHLASRPAAVRNWAVFAESLPDLVALAAPADGLPGSVARGALAAGGSSSRAAGRGPELGALLAELAGRPRAVAARLAYLLGGAAPELADLLQPRPAAGVVYFGPREPTRRFSSRFNVADTLLPFDPGQLRPSGGPR